MKPKILNLEEALKMYDLIGEYLPKETTTQIDAIHTMVHNMGIGKYLKCLALLTGEDATTIVNTPQEERLTAFLTGFQENRLFELPRLKVLHA